MCAGYVPAEGIVGDHEGEVRGRLDELGADDAHLQVRVVGGQLLVDGRPLGQRAQAGRRVGDVEGRVAVVELVRAAVVQRVPLVVLCQPRRELALGRHRR